MNRSRIIIWLRIIVTLTSIAVLLPACMSTASTSGHVNAKLREHGV